MPIDRSSLQYKWDMHWIRTFFTYPERSIGRVRWEFIFKYKIEEDQLDQLARVPLGGKYFLGSQLSVFVAQGLRFTWMYDLKLEDSFDIADRLYGVKSRMYSITNKDRKELKKSNQDYRSFHAANWCRSVNWEAHTARQTGCNLPAAKRSQKERTKVRPNHSFCEGGRNKTNYSRGIYAQQEATDDA